MNGIYLRGPREASQVVVDQPLVGLNMLLARFAAALPSDLFHRIIGPSSSPSPSWSSAFIAAGSSSEPSIVECSPFDHDRAPGDVHLVIPGKDHARELERFRRALELQWDYYGPFGFAAVLAEADEPMHALDMRVDADMLMKKEIALFGTPAEVAEAIMRVKESCGYEDFMFHTWFETGGFSGEEVEEQIAEEVMPLLARACGGLKKNPELGQNLEPHAKG